MAKSPLHTVNSKAEKKRRVGKVLEWLVSGVPYNTIVKMGVDEWGVDERSVSRYIKRAREEVIPTWYEWGNQRVLAAEAIAKAEKLFARAIGKDQLAVALNALKWIGELQGLTVAQQVAKTNLAEPNARASLSLDSWNSARQLYGLPQWDQTQWDAYHSKPANGSN